MNGYGLHRIDHHPLSHLEVQLQDGHCHTQESQEPDSEQKMLSGSSNMCPSPRKTNMNKTEFFVFLAIALLSQVLLSFR
jgi:hypothetical protein